MAVRRTCSGIQRRKPSLRDLYPHVCRAFERVCPASVFRRRDGGAGCAYRALDIHVDESVAQVLCNLASALPLYDPARDSCRDLFTPILQIYPACKRPFCWVVRHQIRVLHYQAADCVLVKQREAFVFIPRGFFYPVRRIVAVDRVYRGRPVVDVSHGGFIRACDTFRQLIAQLFEASPGRYTQVSTVCTAPP